MASNGETEESPDPGSGGSRLRIYGLLALFVLTVLVLISLPIHLTALFMPIPLLGIFGGMSALGMISFSSGQWVTAWRCLVKRNGTGSRSECRLAAGLFRMMAAYAIALGAVWTLTGLIAVLGNVDDPKKLGPGVALTLLSSLYGALLAVALMVAGTIAGWRRDGMASLRSRSMKPVTVAAAASAGTVGVGVLCIVAVHWALTILE